MNASVTLRPIAPIDMEFLLQVYASTRQEELALVDWDDAQKDAFLRMQFQMQHRYYCENYLNADFQVIEVDGKPAGRLYLHRRSEEIRIMDIALLPGYRQQGIGSQLIRQVQAEGSQKSVPVTIHVERFNPALRLYERLGFSLVEERGVYLFLRWLPPEKAG